MVTDPKPRSQVDALWDKVWTGARQPVHLLGAVQSVFLFKRHLEIADVYEPLLDMYGADAVDEWLSEKEINEIINFVKKISV